MRQWLVALICAGFISSTYSQTVWTPHPVSVALTIGQWLNQDSKKLYYIEVESRAPTFEQAKQEGFRLAAEYAVGNLILSESESRNSRLVRDDITTYSSAYVDRFKITKREDVSGGVILNMQVWVAHSAIANRLLNQSTVAGNIDGERVATQISTITQTRQTADKVLSTVLNDFPKRAFDIKLDTTKIVYTNQRTGQLYIGFFISWNRTFINSLSETLTVINQKPKCGPYSFRIHCQDAYQVEIAVPGFTSNTRAYFEDTITERIFRDQVWVKRPGILLELKDFNGNRILRQCYPDFHQAWNYLNFGQIGRAHV